MEKKKEIMIDDTTNYDSSTLWNTPAFSRKEGKAFSEIDFVHKLIGQKPAGTLIDVGACIGRSSRLFLESGWTVYGFEPDPSNRARLKQNLQDFSAFTCDPRAVDEVSGKSVSFFTSTESIGISSLAPFTTGHKKTTSVETVSLRDYCKEQSIKSVDVLKIDAEGYDLMVLKSFPWESIRPSVVTAEFENKKTVELLGYDTLDLANFLTEMNYIVYFSEWHPILRYGTPHDWRCFRPYPYQPKIDSWGNIIAFRDKQDESILLKTLKENIRLKRK